MRFKRWISSMKSTCRGLRCESTPKRSAGVWKTGPEATLIGTCSDSAMMWASVVLPSPGGPESSTWSSGSFRFFAASMNVRRFDTICGCPMKSGSRFGRNDRSSLPSSTEAFGSRMRPSEAIVSLPSPAASLTAPRDGQLFQRLPDEDLRRGLPAGLLARPGDGDLRLRPGKPERHQGHRGLGLGCRGRRLPLGYRCRQQLDRHFL